MRVWQQRRRQRAIEVRRRCTSQGDWMISVHRNGRDWQLANGREMRRLAMVARALAHGGRAQISVAD